MSALSGAFQFINGLLKRVERAEYRKAGQYEQKVADNEVREQAREDKRIRDEHIRLSPDARKRLRDYFRRARGG